MASGMSRARRTISHRAARFFNPAFAQTPCASHRLIPVGIWAVDDRRVPDETQPPLSIRRTPPTCASLSAAAGFPLQINKQGAH